MKFLFSSMDREKKFEKYYASAQAAYDSGRYKRAQEYCDSALEILEGVEHEMKDGLMNLYNKVIHELVNETLSTSRGKR